MNISVRTMKKSDIVLIVDYFINADTEFLKGMGAEKSKLPTRTVWIKKLNQEFDKHIEDKEFYYIIWQINSMPIGHSNINKIDYGNTATMHLHLWKDQKRKKGLGLDFLNQTIPIYFTKFKLKKIICEPYALNLAPNKILKKVGFQFVRNYETVPGEINFYQAVNRYELTIAQFKQRSRY